MPNLTRRKLERITEPWLRTKADEEALASGRFYFSLMHATFPIWWIEKYCRLYEGSEYAGRRLLFRSHQPTEPNWWTDDDDNFEGDELAPPKWVFEPKRGDAAHNAVYEHCRAWAEARAEWHLDRHRKGLQLDWQYEFHARVYGWMNTEPHKKWKRRLRRFKSGNIWCAKKNKKTPTMAGVLHYHLSGDGEQGAGVYVSAKNGKQAQRVIRHAKMMRDRSPTLRAWTRYHKAEKYLANDSLDSEACVLTSGNERHSDAEEGRNGSLLLSDEVHQISRALIDTAHGMGISRPEFLHLGYSIAGDDHDSYGKEQWERGEATNNWDPQYRDFHHLHLSYHVPQNITRQEFAKAPVKYGKMANPAWGDTIDPEEFKHDWDKSKHSAAAAEKFLQRRGNKWIRGTAAMIDMQGWAEGAVSSMRLEQLAELGGGAGLDYARKDDFAACVFSCFPTADLLKKWGLALGSRQADDFTVFWPLIFVPAPRVDELAEELPALVDWAEAGDVIVIESRVIHYEMMLEHLVSPLELLGTQVLRADLTFATELIDSIEQRFGRMESVGFTQGLNHWASPTENFDARVKDDLALHPANPAFTWMIGNMHARERGKLRMPTKGSDPNRKIDGGTAAIMADDAAQLAGKRTRIDWENYAGAGLV